MSRVVEIEVNCPVCGNVSRPVRRRCKNCNRTGKVKKFVPAEEAERMNGEIKIEH